MDYSEINDLRNENEFKGVTFSNFKKSEVKKELLNCFIQSKLEPACYWCAELICAGHFADIWDTIILYYCKYIHLTGAKISVYLEMRLNDFKSILSNGYTDNILGLRNNDKIRKIFCEIICVLCDAKKRHSFDNIKIKPDDMNIVTIKNKFTATDTTYGDEIFLEDDPIELFPFINELAYSVSVDGNNQMNACYWIEWIFEYTARCKCEKEHIYCERRIFAKVDPKFQKDIVWIIWDILKNEASKHTPIIQKIVNALLSLFCFKYTAGCYKKRKNILYLAISILCENIIFEKEIIRHSQTQLVLTITGKINSIYAQIKKNEVAVGTDYLFMDSKSNNLENTIKKIEQLNTFGETFIPRL